MMADAMIHIRPEPDLSIARTIACSLSKAATYHPGNQRRVAERKLNFVTFSKIRRYVLDQDYVFAHDETAIDFKHGDSCEYLAYGAEEDTSRWRPPRRGDVRGNNRRHLLHRDGLRVFDEVRQARLSGPRADPAVG